MVMSWQCLNPIVAVSLCKTDEDKHKLKFISKYQHFNLRMLKDKYGSDNVFLLDCGQCESCRRNYSEEWAIRCVLESKCHDYNYFITLTYDDLHLCKASKKDLDNFLDALEGPHHSRKFKYFCCKEYGESTNRLHYHLVIFSDFELDLYDATKIGDYYYYHSHIIDYCWKFGLYNVAPFESSCARYVAKYANKNGSKIYMSRNIGKKYVLDNEWQIVKDDFQVYGDFGGSYVKQLPLTCIRWLSPSYALKGISLVKDIGATVSRSKVRLYGAPYEESLIINGQEKANSHSSERRWL